MNFYMPTWSILTHPVTHTCMHARTHARMHAPHTYILSIQRFVCTFVQHIILCVCVHVCINVCLCMCALMHPCVCSHSIHASKQFDLKLNWLSSSVHIKKLLWNCYNDPYNVYSGSISSLQHHYIVRQMKGTT